MRGIYSMFSNFVQRSITAALLALLFIVVCNLPTLLFSLILLGILVYVLVYEWPRVYPYQHYSWYAITLCYPILPFALMIYMNEYYRPLFIGMMLTVASFDMGGYIVGSRLGKHKLLPRISPGKTWEGAAGGLLCALFTLWVLVHAYALPYPASFIIMATLVLCIAALMGDLLESWLKRRAGLKDSNSILPGHGGFLDRFDSHMIAIVVVYAMRRCL